MLRRVIRTGLAMIFRMNLWIRNEKNHFATIEMYVNICRLSLSRR